MKSRAYRSIEGARKVRGAQTPARGRMASVLARVRTIPDFPRPGILFRDITPLLLDSRDFRYSVDRLKALVPKGVRHVVSIESRGFIFGSALSYSLRAGFVPIRKEGKLPHAKIRAAYQLEYSSAAVEVHADALKAGERVVLVDDVLATGGTVKAAAKLVRRLGAKIVGAYFLIELSALGGRKKLSGIPVHSLIKY